MLANEAPLPVLTPETTPFWTGGGVGELRICRCGNCRRYIHPPSPICAWCHSQDVSPEVVSGKATILSFTINHQKWLPDMRVPFAIAVVGLAEDQDIHLTTNIVNTPLDFIAIGQIVQVVFQQHGDVWLPLFEPASAA